MHISIKHVLDAQQQVKAYIYHDIISMEKVTLLHTDIFHYLILRINLL